HNKAPMKIRSVPPSTSLASVFRVFAPSRFKKAPARPASAPKKHRGAPACTGTPRIQLESERSVLDRHRHFRLVLARLVGLGRELDVVVAVHARPRGDQVSDDDVLLQ